MMREEAAIASAIFAEISASSPHMHRSSVSDSRIVIHHVRCDFEHGFRVCDGRFFVRIEGVSGVRIRGFIERSVEDMFVEPVSVEIVRDFVEISEIAAEIVRIVREAAVAEDCE